MDADEFLHVEGRSIATLPGAQRRGVRRSRIEMAMASNTPDGHLRALYEAMHLVDDVMLMRLEAVGARLDLALNFETPVRRGFGVRRD